MVKNEISVFFCQEAWSISTDFFDSLMLKTNIINGCLAESFNLFQAGILPMEILGWSSCQHMNIAY